MKRIRNSAAIREAKRIRCQHCCGTYGLQVHHIVSLSLRGDDLAMNLITLCASCHQAAHLRRTPRAELWRCLGIEPEEWQAYLREKGMKL